MPRQANVYCGSYLANTGWLQVDWKRGISLQPTTSYLRFVYVGKGNILEIAAVTRAKNEQGKGDQ